MLLLGGQVFKTKHVLLSFLKPPYDSDPVCWTNVWIFISVLVCVWNMILNFTGPFLKLRSYRFETAIENDCTALEMDKIRGRSCWWTFRSTTTRWTCGRWAACSLGWSSGRSRSSTATTTTTSSWRLPRWIESKVGSWDDHSKLTSAGGGGAVCSRLLSRFLICLCAC